MDVRERLHDMAVSLHLILQHERDGFSTDELTGIGIAMQTLEWTARPAEETRVIVKKPSITFGPIKLGED